MNKLSFAEEWRNKQKAKSTEEEVWEEEPVSFKVFVESASYSNHIPLSKVQYSEIERLIGTDPKQVFKLGKPNTEAAFVWGKGCLDARTQIKDVVTGETHPIQKWSMLGKGVHVYALDEKTNHIVIAKSGVPFRKGKTTLYKVMTDKKVGNGYISLVVASDHKFMTSQREWKRLSELQKGDSLIRLPPLKNDLTWCDVVTITNIEAVGEHEYYDLEIPQYHNYFLRGLLNHNSGKGTTGTLFEAYCIYLHLCMKDPHGYYKVAKQDPLFFVNVATTGEQSRRLFNRLIQRIVGNRWFNSRYIIRKEGRVLNKNMRQEDAKGSIQLTVEYDDSSLEITHRRMSFPKGLEAMSVTSRTSGYEDISMIFGLFDEASGFMTSQGFYNAEEIYNTLRMTTRNLPAYIIMTSWPRFDEDTDFLYKKYLEFLKAEEDAIAEGRKPTQFGSLYATWEVLPEQYPDMFEIEIDERTHRKVMIPEKFRDAFDKKNPVSFSAAKRKYMCIPYGVFERSYEDEPEKVLGIIKDYPPRLATQIDRVNIGGTQYAQHRVVGTSLSKDIPYFLGLDQSKEKAETVLTILHLERDKETPEFPCVVIDAMVVYPTKLYGRHVSVDLVDVLNLIRYLCLSFNVVHIRADHWNSAHLERMLKELGGVKVSIKECKRQEFDFVRELIHKGRLWLPADDEAKNSTKFIKQWTSLIIMSQTNRSQKPKCPPPMLMDAVDSVVEAVIAAKDWFTPQGERMVGMVVSKGAYPSPDEVLKEKRNQQGRTPTASRAVLIDRRSNQFITPQKYGGRNRFG